MSSATMTRRRSPPEFISAIFVGIRTMPAIAAGISSVKMTNERVRTRSRDSRRIRVQTLRMCGLPDLLDEDFLDRRFNQFEAAAASVFGSHSQQLLSVGAGNK